MMLDEGLTLKKHNEKVLEVGNGIRRDGQSHVGMQGWVDLDSWVCCDAAPFQAQGHDWMRISQWSQ